MSDDDKLDRQHLGRMRAWSFDDTLQRQHLLAMRPGVLNRHSMDAGMIDCLVKIASRFEAHIVTKEQVINVECQHLLAIPPASHAPRCG